MGTLLFSAVNVSRFLKVEPEQSLTEACNKFIRRFSQVEELAKERGVIWDPPPWRSLTGFGRRGGTVVNSRLF